MHAGTEIQDIQLIIQLSTCRRWPWFVTLIQLQWSQVYRLCMTLSATLSSALKGVPLTLLIFKATYSLKSGEPLLMLKSKRYHLEIARGSAEEADEYCRKEAGEIFERGTISHTANERRKRAAEERESREEQCKAIAVAVKAKKPRMEMVSNVRLFSSRVSEQSVCDVTAHFYINIRTFLLLSEGCGENYFLCVNRKVL